MTEVEKLQMRIATLEALLADAEAKCADLEEENEELTEELAAQKPREEAKDAKTRLEVYMRALSFDLDLHDYQTTSLEEFARQYRKETLQKREGLKSYMDHDPAKSAEQRRKLQRGRGGIKRAPELMGEALKQDVSVDFRMEFVTLEMHVTGEKANYFRVPTHRGIVRRDEVSRATAELSHMVAGTTAPPVILDFLTRVYVDQLRSKGLQVE